VEDDRVAANCQLKAIKEKQSQRNLNGRTRPEKLSGTEKMLDEKVFVHPLSE